MVCSGNDLEQVRLGVDGPIRQPVAQLPVQRHRSGLGQSRGQRELRGQFAKVFDLLVDDGQHLRAKRIAFDPFGLEQRIGIALEKPDTQCCQQHVAIIEDFDATGQGVQVDFPVVGTTMTQQQGSDHFRGLW